MGLLTENTSANEQYAVAEQTWSSIDVIAPGIFVYHDVLPPQLKIVEILENYLTSNKDGAKWLQAAVGYNQLMPGYRDCVDFKFKTSIHGGTPSSECAKLLCEMYDITRHRQLQAVKDYSATFKIGEMRYWEATNFVKYGVGHHFAEHTDHGFSYNCTVSLVGYANDDYAGGEIEFGLWGIKFKPRAGDLVVFPSNFIYPHRSLAVESGIKYSLVTMLDYSDKFHNQSFYQETGS